MIMNRYQFCNVVFSSVCWAHLPFYPLFYLGTSSVLNIFPILLKEDFFTLLPIKGNLSECKNWMEITLLSIVNKIIAHIINKQQSNYILPRLRSEQAGFRAHRSCASLINIDQDQQKLPNATSLCIEVFIL